MQKILITGACGFIGRYLCRELVKYDLFIIAVDKKCDKDFIFEFSKCHDFYFLNECLTKSNAIKFYKPDYVIHLANSKDNIENLKSTLNLLEQCSEYKVKKFIYGSDASVYGNQTVPFKEYEVGSCQINESGCTKRSIELFAQYYQKTYGFQTIGLRFFTVYGTNDSLLSQYMCNIIDGKPIVTNKSEKDYIFISDAINAIVKIITTKNLRSNVYNIGSEKSVDIMDIIKQCEILCKNKAKLLISYDFEKTLADCTFAKRDLKYKCKTTLENGLKIIYNNLLNGRKVRRLE